MRLPDLILFMRSTAGNRRATSIRALRPGNENCGTPVVGGLVEVTVLHVDWVTVAVAVVVAVLVTVEVTVVVDVVVAVAVAVSVTVVESAMVFAWRTRAGPSVDALALVVLQGPVVMVAVEV
jgi:hypothetical protein